MTNSKELFEENFTGLLNSLDIQKFDSVSFIIIPTTEKENYTNWDDMFRFWTTPIFTGIQLNYEEVIKYLVKETQNLIPLWINISYQEGLPLVMEISQRFRKKREINARSPKNEFPPFKITNDKNINQIANFQKEEAVRILMFNRAINNKIKNLIGHEISIEKIKQSIARILINYRFYPPKPNHQNPTDSNYSKIVINKDFKNSTYSICDAQNLENEIKSKLNMTEAINYYVKHQIGDEFCEIEVKY